MNLLIESECKNNWDGNRIKVIKDSSKKSSVPMLGYKVVMQVRLLDYLKIDFKIQ